MKHKIKISLAVIVIAVIATGVLLTPPKLVAGGQAPEIGNDLDAWLAASEAAAEYPIVPGAEKRIHWQEQGQKTEYALVYLHGFSATRQETAPTAEIVADALGANLFETRLAGHGRAEGALENIKAESWLDDAAEALKVGSMIGDKLIVIGVSTGATLAMAMTEHPDSTNVAAYVLISPNFALVDGSANMLTGPAGPQLAELMVGDTRTFPTANEGHATYWSSTYPTVAVVEMMRLVDLTDAMMPVNTDADLLVIISPNDKVVSPEATREIFASIDTPRKELIEIDHTTDPSQHVLSGRILSPENTEKVSGMIIDFLKSESGS